MLRLLCMFAFLGISALAAEDQATVTTFQLADGSSVEALRFASAGDEGAKTYMITTLDGERKSVPEKEISSRKERVVLVSELPAKAREQFRAAKKAAAVAHAANEKDAEASKTQNQEVAAIVRKEIEARIVFRKINDEWTRLNAEVAECTSDIAKLTGPLASADAEAQSTTTAITALEQRPRDKNELDSARDSRSDTLRRKLKSATNDLTVLAALREELDGRRTAASDKLKDVTAKKDAAQAAIDALVAEKSKAIVASIVKKISPDEKAGAAGAVSVVKLLDGTTIRAKSVKAIDSLALLIVDENGKEHRVLVRNIDLSE